MDNIKALFFDVGGTVFDWKNTVREKVREYALGVWEETR